METEIVVQRSVCSYSSVARMLCVSIDNDAPISACRLDAANEETVAMKTETPYSMSILKYVSIIPVFRNAWY